jgi:hypothetical protein
MERESLGVKPAPLCGFATRTGKLVPHSHGFRRVRNANPSLALVSRGATVRFFLARAAGSFPFC